MSMIIEMGMTTIEHNKFFVRDEKYFLPPVFSTQKISDKVKHIESAKATIAEMRALLRAERKESQPNERKIKRINDIICEQKELIKREEQAIKLFEKQNQKVKRFAEKQRAIMESLRYTGKQPKTK